MSVLQLFLDWISQPAQWTGPEGIPARLAEHLWYSVVALAVAAAVALPAGLAIGHTGRGAFLVVNSANAARALPTLGLLVLVVTLVGLGLVPVLVPLIALAIPPILVNTYEGIRQVDADLRDAAEGMGMTGREVLLKVEAPVALPLILLGLRTAAIQIVATATIAAYVGLGGLGRFIFDGLARRDYETVVGGAALVALLAVLTEIVFALIQRLVVAPGIRHRAAAR
ncbi:ABC transporter permease [Carbonactinospora thermoautotrophica]|uniref:ABC transporter permease n=1 Tax=Carbonactinospora thermoautotrophica TaxID=1469144 RepID=UPI003DA86101